MSKTKISQYSTTNALNTDIGGIDIDENCLPSNLNDAIREVMVQLKQFQDGSSGDSLTITGTATLNGTTIPASATLTKTTDKLSVFAATSSSELAGVISDETGSGSLVFGTSPTLSSPTITGTGTAAFGNLSYTGTLTGSTGVINIGSGQIYKDASGNLGLGTSSPGTKLQINNSAIYINRTGSTTNGLVIAEQSNAPAGTARWCSIRTVGGESQSLRLQAGQDSSSVFGHIEFLGGSSEAMRINSAGNVGIGTSSPTAPLTVAGGGLLGTNSTNPIAFTGSGDQNAGIGSYNANTDINIYTAGSGNIRFRTGATWSSAAILSDGGTERMRITSSGNVGIGTSSPVDKLHVSGGVKVTSNTPDAEVTGGLFDYFASQGQGRLFAYRSAGGSSLLFYTNPNGGSIAERARIDSSGNLLVGTTSLGSGLSNIAQIEASGTNGGIIINSSSTGASDYCRLLFTKLNSTGNEGLIRYSTNDYHMAFWTDGLERARIDSSGNLLVGTTTSSATNGSLGFRVISSGVPTVQRASGGNFAVFYNSANSAIIGTIMNVGGTATAYNTASDYRLKENIQPMQNALDKVEQLKPCTYTWKVDGSAGQGFIAHELQEVVPDAVTGEKDAVDKDGKPVYQGVDTSFLVATLTAAIQELNAKVESLQAELNTLKGA